MVSRWVQKQMKVAQIPFLDSGLLLSILGMDLGSITTLSEQILIGNATDLVNKGHITEMVAGLEIIKTCLQTAFLLCSLDAQRKEFFS